MADMIADCHSLVVFTGAGVSTESGLPDFRSPGGVWSRTRPVDYQEFLSSQEARTRYWRFYLDFFPDFARVSPNPAHLALAELERRGKLTAIITQNIDRLHQAAGNSPGKVIELHGRIDLTSCLDCGESHPTDEVLERVRHGLAVPVCGRCGGWLKPATISFGQELPPEALQRAVRAASSADLFLAIGSSLTVHPAAALPALAVERGSRLVIINAARTPYDRLARLVVRGRAGEVLSDMIAALH